MPKQKRIDSLEEMMKESDKFTAKMYEAEKRMKDTQMLLESCEENGEDATFNLLISVSVITPKADDLLCMFPVVELAKFIKRIPVHEVDEETFAYWVKQKEVTASAVI